MITFAQNDYPVPRREHLRRSSSFRLCALLEYRSPTASTKPLRMILLQNANNKWPGMILLHKKVGGGVEGALIVPNVFSGKPCRMCTYTNADATPLECALTDC